MGHFLSKDKLSLYYENMEVAKPKAAIIFMHGLGEHIGRYRQVFKDFSSRGYSCFGFDQRGFGQSPGKRGNVDAFTCYMDDLEAFIELVSGKAIGVPIYLFGHSMGSIIVLSYALTNRTPIQGMLIFSCPLRLAQWPGRMFSPIVGKLFSLFPRLSIPNMINPEDLSNDPGILQIFSSDRLVEKKVTLNWLHEFTCACSYIRAHAQRITIPTFIAHGACDRIADVAGAEFLYRHIASEDRILVVYDGFKHELLNHQETDRRKVLEDTFQWLDHRRVRHSHR